jgi:hypothetical protein
VTNAALPLTASYFAQEGIIWIRVDHRGSGHFGKKGAALMHRNLGSVEMRDWIAAVKWLRTKPFVDPARVGITGGSYGGYATCLALTYGADYFTHGLATSPVTDWRLYDSVYAERYMDAPAENSAGYDAASILVHSVKLRGVLFLVHGELDDNVHLQNTVQLIERLTDLGKPLGSCSIPASGTASAGRSGACQPAGVDFWSKHFSGGREDMEACFIRQAACPVCESPAFRPWRKGTFETTELDAQAVKRPDSRYGRVWDLSRCDRCGHTFADPCPAPEFVEALYARLEDPAYDEEAAGRTRNFARLLRRLEKIRPGRGTLCDVGAATGILMDLARRRGWTVEGVEPSGWAVAAARAKYGLAVRQGIIETAEFPAGSFDAVTMVDLIEHTARPRAAVVRAAEVLKAAAFCAW